MDYVSVYNRQEGGRSERTLEAESLEVAETLRASQSKSLGEHYDVVIEDHDHPVEYHQLGSHGEYVIGSANGKLGAWPAAGTFKDFVAADQLDAELQDACSKYGS
jgi:hypothetical protein